jgi:uncharacterized membrane protein YbhN (UPF0104 family)
MLPYIKWLYKAGVFLLLAGILWFELGSKDKLPGVWAAFRAQLHGAQSLWLVVAFVLMPLNWLAETQKWYRFVRQYESISRWKALRAVLSGVSFSLFTPNRVGEYAGRVLYISPENQWKALIVNLVGNFAQYLVLLSAGVLGALWYMLRFWHLDRLYVQLFCVVAASGFAVMFFVYFNIGLVIPLARRIPLLHHVKRFVKDIQTLRHFTRAELAYILGWAGIRYVVYATQYVCLLYYFNIQVPVLDGFAGVSALFLLQMSIPLPPITGLVARGGLAVQLWSMFGANEVSALAATFSLWIINLILPALIGTFSLFYVNISKTLGYEDD